MKRVIQDVYSGFNIFLETFPSDNEVDPLAYIAAINAFPRGSVVIIFTPDDTHYDIAMEAIKHGCHVLVSENVFLQANNAIFISSLSPQVTKPAVKTLDQHRLVTERLFTICLCIFLRANAFTHKIHQFLPGRALHAAAVEHGVLVSVEVHKRWDPIYGDARDRYTSSYLLPICGYMTINAGKNPWTRRVFVPVLIHVAAEASVGDIQVMGRQQQ